MNKKKLLVALSLCSLLGTHGVFAADEAGDGSGASAGSSSDDAAALMPLAIDAAGDASPFAQPWTVDENFNLNFDARCGTPEASKAGKFLGLNRNQFAVASRDRHAYSKRALPGIQKPADQSAYGFYLDTKNSIAGISGMARYKDFGAAHAFIAEFQGSATAQTHLQNLTPDARIIVTALALKGLLRPVVPGVNFEQDILARASTAVTEDEVRACAENTRTLFADNPFITDWASEPARDYVAKFAATLTATFGTRFPSVDLFNGDFLGMTAEDQAAAADRIAERDETRLALAQAAYEEEQAAAAAMADAAE